MHITIVAVGQKLPAWAQTAVDDYLARFPRDFTVIVKEVKAEARTGGKPVAQVMAAEAERIERAVPAGDILVAMDEHGRDMTTVDFSKKISGWKNEGCGVTFIIGGADGPTAIFVANTLGSQYLGAIMVAAYSYMALVPIVQPPVIRLLTTRKERRISMPYQQGKVTQLTKILFPILVTVIAGLVAPASVALVGFLMFGNLLRECGVLNALSETAQNVLANLITILLGLTVAGQMTADKFVRPDTLLILALGLVAFVFDTAGGVLFAKLLNLFLPEGKKLNPMIGAAGISAFPMSGRVVNKMGLEEDPQNFLLMYSVSVNVSGQIASVIAGGLILTLLV